MKKELQRPKILLGLLVTLAMAVSVIMAVPVMAAPPVLTGNVESDFTDPGVLIISDASGDVGLPSNAPPGTVSGWDLKELRLFHDAASDTMYVGLNTFGILGDADGDGNPGGTSGWLAADLGEDLPNGGGTETAAVYFDLNQDGTWDVIAGVSAAGNYSGGSVNSVTYPFSPGYSFGSPLAAHIGTISPNPDGSHPDLEGTITNWSTLPGQDSSPAFRVGAMLGAYDQDDGIGEDFLEYVYSVAPPVGGSAFPVDRLGLLAPWAVLLVGCAAAVTLLVLRKRRQA